VLRPNGDLGMDMRAAVIVNGTGWAGGGGDGGCPK
jgi:hypothetical protein